MADNDWWVQRLNELKLRLALSEVGMARRLEISPAMLGHVRAGRRPLPVPARIRLLDALGYVLTRDLLLRLLPDDVRAAVRAADNGRAESSKGKNDTNAGREMPPEGIF